MKFGTEQKTANEENTGVSFLRISVDETLTVIPLTNLNAPAGETPDGSNCMAKADMYFFFDIPNRPEDVPLSIQKPDSGEDPIAALGRKPNTVYFLWCLVEGGENESNTPTIWQFKSSVFKQLVEIEDAVGGEIKGQTLRFKRSGSGLKTRYTVMPTGKVQEDIEEPPASIAEYVREHSVEEINGFLAAMGLIDGEIEDIDL